MGRTVAIGIQNFEELITGDWLYIDKTAFIKEWWESGDAVTLITRPRRFGKTLNMSMLERFFSIRYAGRGDLFEGLSIWQEEKYRELQGTYPVIALSFAKIKESSYPDARKRICMIIKDVYEQFDFLADSEMLSESDKEAYHRVTIDMDDIDAADSLSVLSRLLAKHYGKKPLILLDEYDTPMQEAYLSGFWTEIVKFTRNLFNATFKTNPWLGRAVMTGITRVSKESFFSDLNHLEVVTATSNKYTACFGFTQEEVSAALEECGLQKKKALVKKWYDGFIFGKQKGIYNPWSILNFLGKGEIGTYWVNTSSNALAAKLLWEGGHQLKEQFEVLLHGGSILVPIDEQIVFNRLEQDSAAVWSLLVASGYLKILKFDKIELRRPGEKVMYELIFTNLEVAHMFQNMVVDWFAPAGEDYNDFIKALLRGDIEEMNGYMNRVALSTISFHDTGAQPSEQSPERFYHGFALGLMVDLQGRYQVISNRESGFGRYDVMLEPKDPETDDAIILEFKVHDPEDEDTLEDTAAAALRQIEEKQYAAQLLAKGIPAERIRCYGFAFEGKRVLIR